VGHCLDEDRCVPDQHHGFWIAVSDVSQRHRETENAGCALYLCLCLDLSLSLDLCLSAWTSNVDFDLGCVLGSYFAFASEGAALLLPPA